MLGDGASGLTLGEQSCDPQSSVNARTCCGGERLTFSHTEPDDLDVLRDMAESALSRPESAVGRTAVRGREREIGRAHV